MERQIRADQLNRGDTIEYGNSTARIHRIGISGGQVHVMLAGPWSGLRPNSDGQLTLVDGKQVIWKGDRQWVRCATEESTHANQSNGIERHLAFELARMNKAQENAIAWASRPTGAAINS